MKNKKTYAIVSLFVLFLAIVFVGIGSVIMSTPVTINAVTSGNYTATLMNGGRILEDQGFLFAIDNNGMSRRVTKDGSGKVQVNSDATGFLQYVGKDYYYNVGNKLFIANFEGTKRMLISYAKNPLIIGSLIYYINADGLICKTSVNDIDKKIAPKILNIKPNGEFMVYMQNIYFIGENKRLYASNADGKEISLFLDYPIDKFCIDGQYIYFHSNEKIYSASFQNVVTVKEIIEGESFIVQGKYILYNTKSALFCLDMSAKEKQEELRDSTDSSKKSQTLNAAKPVKLFGATCEGFGMDKNYCYFFAPNGELYRVKPGNNQVDKF